jgi:hypothetical protein
MSSSLKVVCITCEKNAGIFKCEGCSQVFCTKHATEHRQTLNHQLDQVVLEHDTLKQVFIEHKNQHDPLLAQIDQWEKESIDKIRQTADDARKKTGKTSSAE